ncbi:MAG: hypothetical protein AB7F66_00360 [Bacteriovoracia bacterium]
MLLLALSAFQSSASATAAEVHRVTQACLDWFQPLAQYTGACQAYLQAGGCYDDPGNPCQACAHAAYSYVKRCFPAGPGGQWSDAQEREYQRITDLFCGGNFDDIGWYGGAISGL